MNPNKLAFMPTDESDTIDVNLYQDEGQSEVESLLFFVLTKEHAIQAAADLLTALAHVGANRADIEAAITRDSAPPSTPRLWDVFEASYGTCIQREDSPEDGRAPLASDNEALELCITEAKAGDARAIEALCEIARAHHDACLGE